MRPDGSACQRLTNFNKNDANHPNCSPDGKHIVFQIGSMNKYSNKKSDIYKMKTDGSGIVRLTNNPAHDKVPVFSSDGRFITFQSYRDGNFELYRMRSDGSEQIRLTKHPAKDIPVQGHNGPETSFHPCLRSSGLRHHVLQPSLSDCFQKKHL